MRIGGGWDAGDPSPETIKRGLELVECALAEGINHFDHADIYGQGRCEKVFGEVWESGLVRREDVILQSKCGIRFEGDPTPASPGRYDFSRDHIVTSVEKSLVRLKTDFLDVLLLHRPDPLCEPEEVAEAFDILESDGKVRHFGVSNHTVPQIALLQKFLRQKLIINQIQLNLAFMPAINAGIVAGYGEEGVMTRGEGVLEYCRLHDMTVQAYAPLAAGSLTRAELHKSESPLGRTVALVHKLADEKKVSPEAIVLAWILRLPSGVQPVVGTTSSERLHDCCESTNCELSREEWYALFTVARGQNVP
jgi:predicted oxidoreductase